MGTPWQVKQAAALCIMMAGTDLSHSGDGVGDPEKDALLASTAADAQYSVLKQVPLLQELFPAGVTAQQVTAELGTLNRLYSNHYRKGKQWCVNDFMKHYVKCIDERTQTYYSGRDEDWAMNEVAKGMHEEEKRQALRTYSGCQDEPSDQPFETWGRRSVSG